MRQWEYTTHEERRVLLSAASTSINNRSTRTLWWKTESALEQSAPLPGMVLAYLLFRQAVVLAIKGRGRFLPLSLSLSNFKFVSSKASNLWKYMVCFFSLLPHSFSLGAFSCSHSHPPTSTTVLLVCGEPLPAARTGWKQWRCRLQEQWTITAAGSSRKGTDILLHMPEAQSLCNTDSSDS